MEGSKTGRGANNKKKFTCSKWHWQQEEDKLLTELVQRFGPSNWDHIADYFQGRTGKSCRLRWVNQLNPKIDKTPFSAEERQRLLELHQSYGNKWSTISSFFPGRTDNQLKNQYHVLVGSRNIKASCPSSSTNPHDARKKGSVDLSQFESLSTHAGGSQFTNVSYHGNSNSGFAPQSTTIFETPFVGDGSSSFYGKDQTWFAECCFNLCRLSPVYSDRINLETIHSNQRTSPGESMRLIPNYSDRINLETIHSNQRTSHGESMRLIPNYSDRINLEMIHSNQRTSHGESMMSELCQVVQSQKGLDVKDSQFIDFFGLGKSE